MARSPLRSLRQNRVRGSRKWAENFCAAPSGLNRQERAIDVTARGTLSGKRPIARPRRSIQRIHRGCGGHWASESRGEDYRRSPLSRPSGYCKSGVPNELLISGMARKMGITSSLVNHAQMWAG